MALLLHDNKLMELMEDFYILTGMKIVLFDGNFSEIFSYPQSKDTFCSRMRKNEDFDKKCRDCDKVSLAKCTKASPLNIYKCHAGLIEATAPVMENGRIIGYLMFGQITDNKNRAEFASQMEKLCIEYKITEDLSGQIKKIKYRSNKQIMAASKIMDACTGYIQLKELVRPSGKRFIEPIDQFIQSHLNEDISVARLCREFNISRTRLYNLMGEYMNGGIASFIRHKRIEKAKQMIKSTDMSISEIAYEVGFCDYNYFLRAFKRDVGLSPKQFKNVSKNTDATERLVESTD